MAKTIEFKLYKKLSNLIFTWPFNIQNHSNNIVSVLRTYKNVTETGYRTVAFSNKISMYMTVLITNSILPHYIRDRLIFVFYYLKVEWKTSGRQDIRESE